MKVLWITYAPLGRAAQLIEHSSAQSGTWIDAALNSLDMKELKVGVACIASHDAKIVDEENGTSYYGLGNIPRVHGRIPRTKDTAKWKLVIKDFNPDLILVWGTEYACGCSVLDAAGPIPVLFYIQGVIGRITDYPLGMICLFDVLRYMDPVSLIKFGHIIRIHSQQKKQKQIEKEMICRSSGIITDNDWADSYYRSVYPNVHIFHLPLPVNKVFLDGKHTMKLVERQTIFTIDGSHPAKGMHHLLLALKIVKRAYPEVKVYIPGRIPSKKPWLIFESPYYTYLRRMIKRDGLAENVMFCGRLDAEEMKHHLLSCHLFVMPSCIENHSSSLREAMYLGVPCVTALVGAVPEYTQYGYNALCYRYEEVDMLADCILRLLNDESFSEKIGNNAAADIRLQYPMYGYGNKMMDVFQDAVKNGQR